MTEPELVDPAGRGTGQSTVEDAHRAPGLLHRISRVISRHGCNVELVLISTEGARAIDVFHLTAGGAKLAEDAETALTADLQRMLEGRDEVD